MVVEQSQSIADQIGYGLVYAIGAVIGLHALAVVRCELQLEE